MRLVRIKNIKILKPSRISGIYLKENLDWRQVQELMPLLGLEEDQDYNDDWGQIIGSHYEDIDGSQLILMLERHSPDGPWDLSIDAEEPISEDVVLRLEKRFFEVLALQGIGIARILRNWEPKNKS